MALLLGGARLEAQGRELDKLEFGGISGRVVDADSYGGLDGVVVQLQWLGDTRTGAAPGPVRSTVTDESGTYRFDRLPAGRYRVRVARLGYMPASVEVQLVPGDAAQVGVGLIVEPVELPALEITGRQPQPFVRTEGRDAENGGARVDVARRRQGEYLVSDARELTQGEIVEAVTLGETDLFRALHRVPGVTTRDDYTAMIWTRGATWDQTRVYFDGLPLYNPTHSGWLFSAINPDAVGGVGFHPGHRPARWGEGAAGILDLRSRMGGDAPLLGAAEVSPVTARLRLDGRIADDRIGWMVAGRRTYVDVLSDLAGGVMGEDVLSAVPYDFSDLVGRVDAVLGAGWSATASGIVERDYLRGDIKGLVRGNRGRWGNRSGQLSAQGPIGPVKARVSTGQTRFATEMREQLPDSARWRSTFPALSNSIRHHQFAAEIRPALGDTARWALGYQLVHEVIGYRGPYSLLSALTQVLPRDSLDLQPSSFTNALQYSALWGERRWVGVERRWEVVGGLRAEFGDSVWNGGRLRMAPRLAARVWLDELTALSAAWGRSYQYAQDVGPAVGPIGPELHLSAVWMGAQPAQNQPAARSDVATLGMERWVDEGWLMGLNIYHRYTDGLMLANPDTGLIAFGRAAATTGSNAAWGFEASLRKLAGRWTGSLGYSYGDSEIESRPAGQPKGEATWRYPSSADVRQAVDATAMARVSKAVRVGGAFTWGSGVPFTRLILADPSRRDGPPRLEAPNALRTPAYASLDLMADYTRSFGSVEFSAYAQLRNALDRDNRVTYLGSVDCEPAADARLAMLLTTRKLECGPGDQTVEDRFHEGLPWLPLVGVRVSF